MFVSISHLVPMNPTSLQVAAQVVSGIGFLGAGVIMREGLSINDRLFFRADSTLMVVKRQERDTRR